MFQRFGEGMDTLTFWKAWYIGMNGHQPIAIQDPGSHFSLQKSRSIWEP